MPFLLSINPTRLTVKSSKPCATRILIAYGMRDLFAAKNNESHVTFVRRYANGEVLAESWLEDYEAFYGFPLGFDLVIERRRANY